MLRSRPIAALPGSAFGLLLAASLVVAAPVAPPFDLYEIGPAPAESVAPAAEAPGTWIVLRQETSDGRTWALLALPDGETGGDLPGIGRPRYLGRVRAGELVVMAAPADAEGDRLRSGRPVSVAPSGATVLVTRESAETLAERAHAGFHVLTRSFPFAAPRSPGPPEGLATVLERVRGAEAAGALRTRQEVQARIDLVSPDSLRRWVEGLSLDGGFQPSSRWWWDPRTRGVKADSIVAWLSSALGPTGTVDKHRFEWDGHFVDNIVGKYPSANPDAGAILVTAHYDAIGARSDPLEICAAGLRLPDSGCDCTADSSAIGADPDCRWNPDSETRMADPAPGADDNATGIGAMIETARALSGTSFDFDIYYVAFQAEELGLIGSAAFADSVVSDGDPQEIFAVLNMDMLGYNADQDQLDVVTNRSSEWFADWIVDTATEFLPDLPVEKRVIVFGRSDHASFWSVGIDAILLFEDIDLPYPEYHTFQDLWENVFPADGRPNSEQQFLRAAQLSVATLARLALHYEAPDLAIPVGEVSARPAVGLHFEAGRDVVLQARVHNFGTSRLVFQGVTVDSLSARVRFYDGDPDAGGTLIGEATRRTFFASGGIETIEATWATEPGQEGFHEIHALVEGLDLGYAQVEVDRNNNRGSYELFLRGADDAGPRALTHYSYPSPARGDVSSLTFYYELTAPAEVEIEVYDLEGTALGFYAARLPIVDEGNQPGANRVSGALFRRTNGSGPLSLKSGVYVYVLSVSDARGTVTDRQKGKFALVR